MRLIMRQRFEGEIHLCHIPRLNLNLDLLVDDDNDDKLAHVIFTSW